MFHAHSRTNGRFAIGLTAILLGFGAAFAQGSPVPVEIDILPGEPQNLVDPDDPAALPVAILGGTIPVETIDPATVRLGTASLMKHGDGALARRVDVNGDGREDLLLLVNRRSLKLGNGPLDLTLTASTREGLPLLGKDRVMPLAAELARRRAALAPLDRSLKTRADSIRIDVLPGDASNRIDVSARGIVPVVIFSDPGFDATTLEPASIAFAGQAVTPIPGGALTESRDVDADGFADLVVHFVAARLAPARGTIEATLAGMTDDGRLVVGHDRVQLVELQTVTFSSRRPDEPAGRQFVGPGPITIPGSGPASPYPAELTVSGITGVVSKVRVSLLGLQHDFLEDLDILLVGPTGQGAILMSDIGGPNSALLDLTFDDFAPFPPPYPNALESTTYRPHDDASEGPDSWPAPASPGPVTPWLGAFNGTDPNGTWQLFVVDDVELDSGSIAEWRLEFLTAHRFCSETTLAIPDQGAVSDTLVVPDLGAVRIAKLTADLRGLTHDYPRDLDIILGDPANAGMMLMSDVGGDQPVEGLDLTFDDHAHLDVPELTPPPPGTYRTTDLGSDPDSFPTGAPVNHNLGLFGARGDSPLGTWSLWLADDNPVDTGVLAHGWCLTFTTVPAEELSNPTPIVLPAGAPLTTEGAADPYPSEILVSGVFGTVRSVRVTLHGFTHTFPDDVDLLLAGPSGETAMLMSDAGGSGDVFGLTLVFDDNAATDVPAASLASGVYRPTDYNGGDSDAFPAPAPAGSHLATLSLFNDDPPNGLWTLWVLDDGPGDYGAILDGWSLTLELLSSWESVLSFTAVTPSTSGPASPYPLQVDAVDMPRPIESVDVSLYIQSIPRAEDLDLLLEGPQGETVVLMSDVGGSNPIYTTLLVLSDDSTDPIPSSPLGPNEICYPTDLPPADTWPSPAPVSSALTNLSVFAGTDPNGPWKLWIHDDDANPPTGSGTIDFWLTFQPAYPVGEVRGLRFVEGPTLLAWNAADNATLYSIYRGELSELSRLVTTDPEGCHRGQAVHTLLESVVDVPLSGTGYWYLVRGTSSAGEGPAGFMRLDGAEHARLHDTTEVCPQAAIDIEKATNGLDADSPPGPSILEGTAVSWSYVVTNTGDQALTGVTVVDDQGVTVSCPATFLPPGGQMVCTATGTAVTGQYSNVATVYGTPPLDPVVTDTDPSHYFGLVTATGTCT